MNSFLRIVERTEAAIHPADRTARPQVLEEGWNSDYYKVIKASEAETGHGAGHRGMLNTSFNLHGYPIVHGPREALWTFANSGLRCLVLGN